jgi:hypothetical protein
MEVKTLKLITGEEVIARVKEEFDFYKLNHPVMAIQTPQGMGLIQYCITSSDEEITINADNVIVIANTRKELADQYLQQVTGLTLTSGLKI